MKSIKKIVAVTLVTALCFVASCIPAFASSLVPFELGKSAFEYLDKNIIIPSPRYPDSSSLPYGVDTGVYEIWQRANNGYILHRLYMKLDYSSSQTFDSTTGTSIYRVSNSTGRFSLIFISKEVVYYETLAILDDKNDVVYSDSVVPITQKNAYGMYTGQLVGTLGEGSILPVTYPLYYSKIVHSGPFMFGGNLLTSTYVNSIPDNIWNDYFLNYPSVTVNDSSRFSTYPTSADIEAIQNEQIKDSINNVGNVISNKLDEVESSIDKASSDIQGSINDSSELITGQIVNLENSIIDAGGDIPDIDTDTSWMDESITKMNEWLSQLEEFGSQLSDSEQENAENMEQASAFLQGFFDCVPDLLKAGLMSVLVMIVVIKIIGR